MRGGRGEGRCETVILHNYCAKGFIHVVWDPKLGHAFVKCKPSSLDIVATISHTIIIHR